MRLMWVAEQRLVIKALGSGHLVTRQIQRDFRRSGVKERGKLGVEYANIQGRSLEKGVFEKACATEAKHSLLGLSSW